MKPTSGITVAKGMGRQGKEDKVDCYTSNITHVLSKPKQ